MTKRIALLKSVHQFRLKELETADAIRAEKIAPHIAKLSKRINPKTKVRVKVEQAEIFNNCKPKKFEGWKITG